MNDSKRKKHIEAWLGRVKYDMETAAAMYKTGRHTWFIWLSRQSKRRLRH